MIPTKDPEFLLVKNSGFLFAKDDFKQL